MKAGELAAGDRILIKGELATVTEVKDWSYGLKEVHYKRDTDKGVATLDPDEDVPTSAQRPYETCPNCGSESIRKATVDWQCLTCRHSWR